MWEVPEQKMAPAPSSTSLLTSLSPLDSMMDCLESDWTEIIYSWRASKRCCSLSSELTVSENWDSWRLSGR